MHNNLKGIYCLEAESGQVSTIHHLQNRAGTGEMNCYDVAPGIQISYNNLNMDSCFQPLKLTKDFLQIDHCLEGCYEFELESGLISFLGKGDLCVSNLARDTQIFVSSRIPVKKYRGITVLLDMEIAQTTLDKDCKNAQINLALIRDKLCTSERALLIKSKREIDHIFGELYHVDERIRLPYLWIKANELLLFLSLLDGSSTERPQLFSERLSIKTQEVYQYLIENPFARTTISELAEIFDIAESSMKRCFKSISGVSIGTFAKIKRMEAAADLLVSERNLNIGEIAEIAGYENQSKFSAAFKSIHEITPIAYRHKHS